MAWTKGQSGNPAGRNKDKAFADQLRLVVNEEDGATGVKKLRRLAEKLVSEAMNGEGWAMCQVADRLDGKPAQEAALTIDDHRFVARVPEKAKTTEQWQKQHSQPTAH